MSMNKNTQSLISKDDLYLTEKAVNLSAIEVFLGSFLHAMSIPLSGHFLSLNQGAFLTACIKNVSNRFFAAKFCFEVSLITAIMKSIAPSSKKLGPMISISNQGTLYSLGIVFGGTGILGQITGMILLSLWAFIQPFVTFFIIYGSNLTEAIFYYQDKLGENLYSIILILIGIKVLLASFIPVIINILGDESFKKYQNFLRKYKIKRRSRKIYRPLEGAIRDLLRPSVLIGFALMGIFFYFHRSDKALLIYDILRPIAIAFIIFYIIRLPIVYEKVEHLAKKNRYFNRIFRLAEKSFQNL